MNCFAFHKQHDLRHLQNVQSVAALELAIGCHLPNDFGAWPLGLADNWNAAAASTFLTPRMKRSVTATTTVPAAGFSCAMTKARRRSSIIK